MLGSSRSPPRVCPLLSLHPLLPRERTEVGAEVAGRGTRRGLPVCGAASPGRRARRWRHGWQLPTQRASGDEAGEAPGARRPRHLVRVRVTGRVRGFVSGYG